MEVLSQTDVQGKLPRASNTRFLWASLGSPLGLFSLSLGVK